MHFLGHASRTPHPATLHFGSQLYQKYTNLFEGEWVAFTEQIGASSLEEMHEMLAKDMSEEEQSSQFYEGLLASMEYPKFAK